jgi:hypothetical protein
MSDNLQGELELRISCQGLADTDVFSKSDPLVAVFLKTEGINDKKQYIGKTE